MDLSQYALIIVATVLVDNVVLSRILGLCPFMGVSKSVSSSIGLGLATAFVLTLACGAAYLVNQLLVMFDLTFLRTLSFILVIAAVVQFIEMMMRKTNPELYQVLGIYLPLITTNCAVLGVPLLTVQEDLNFVGSLLFGFGSAMGFALVLVLFGAIRERLEGADIPLSFQGAAIGLITAGLMSLAFMGFGGLAR